jgi:hypothetical protein
MSLVYTTMFAIVPLLALAFSVLKGLGVHRDFEPILRSRPPTRRRTWNRARTAARRPPA